MSEEQKKMLLKIQELSFTLVDLNLFLDTHPDCQQALIDYNNLTQEILKLKHTYQMKYGPLTNFGHCPSKYPWQWVKGPWPWEFEAN